MKLLILTLLIGVACAAVLRKETMRNEVMDMWRDLLAERDEDREVRNVLRELLAERDQARRAEYVRRIPTEEQIREDFRKNDGDGDGEISFTELKALVTALGLPPDDEFIRMTIGLADTDGNGTMSFKEYMNYIKENF